MTKVQSFFNLLDFFLGKERLNEIGSRTAIEFRSRQFTYNDLRSEVSYWMGEITSRNVREGDRVAMLLYDSPEFIAALLATTALSAICVPINTYLGVEEVRFIIKDSGSKLVISESDLAEKFGLQSQG